MAEKPEKPYPDFPLFPHASGQWAKKIRGKLRYFGVWAEPNAALTKYCEQRDDLQAGREPRANRDGMTVLELCNRYLTAKQALVDSGELALRTFQTYYHTNEGVLSAFGKSRLVEDLGPEDFEKLRAALAKKRGPVALGNEIQRVRSLFKYANDLIDSPVKFGSQFRKPSRKVLREIRNAAGSRMFEAAELRKIIAAADNPLKAMILLGVNCGYGQTDIASLPISALDLKKGWADYPRPKTAVRRRCPLWPETVEAIQAAIKDRPIPLDPADGDLVFITRWGRRFVRLNKTGTPDDAIGKEFGKLLDDLKLKRPGVRFYGLRRIVETIGGESKDQVAVDHIMGHARDDMASRYRERISDKRLLAVSNTIRNWLFPPKKKRKKA